MRTASPLTFLGTLLIVAGIAGACVLSARASAAVGECASSASPTAAAPERTAPLFARASDGSYTLSRGQLMRALEDPSAVSRAVRFEPVMKRGKPVAYRVASVAKGSPLAGVLQKGDIIERINDVPLSDLNRSLALLATLDEQSRFDVEGRRGRGALALAVALVD